MSPIEQAALGWQCLLGAISAARRPAVWAPWAVLLALHALFLLACAWASHPALSWLMAPLLRALQDDRALRYPELFRRLPVLSREGGLALSALATPVIAGVSVRLFELVFRGERPEARAAWSEGFARAGALFVVAAPLVIAACGLHTMLISLADVRLSGLTRLAAPYVAGGALLFVRAALAYAPALVVLGRRSGPGALAAVPGTWRGGFVAAAVPFVLLSPLLAAGTVLVGFAPRLVQLGVPEAVLLAVLARAGAEALAGMLASGAVTLVWLGGVGEEEGNR